MTSWCIPTTPNNTWPMSGKYSLGFGAIGYTPKPTSASSIVHNSCEYLGYMLSPDGLTMAQNKIQAIQDWPEPRKVWDIMSFLGFANFYRRFIYGYLEITVPLTWLTRKDIPWVFSDDCRKSFEKLKKAFTTAPVLTHWIPDTPVMVETSVGEVRSQTDWNPVWTGPNPAVLVQVWDFPKNTRPLGPRFGHSHIA